MELFVSSVQGGFSCQHVAWRDRCNYTSLTWLVILCFRSIKIISEKDMHENKMKVYTSQDTIYSHQKNLICVTAGKIAG